MKIVFYYINQHKPV